MMTLIRRTPIETPALNGLVRTLFNDPFFGDLAAPNGALDATLAVDLSEDEHAFVVRASLPGFRKENVEVELHEGVLSIKASRTEETEAKNEKFYRKERREGSVSRRIALPDTASDGDIKAELRDGVLTVRIPKTPEAKPRKVTVG